jgi:Flp pilus assembly protein TadG
MRKGRPLCKLLRDAVGTMAIETALIAPLLAMMALGVFEVSRIVSREQQLQSAANEASEIILAAAGGSGIASTDLEDILETSLGLDPNDLVIAARYRCATGSISTTVPNCGTGQQLYTYAHLTVTASYSPMWTNFGVGSPINYSIQRTVQIS